MTTLPSLDLADVAADWFRAQHGRPLGPVEMTSGQALSPFSRALWLGADNLLFKAAAAIQGKDPERADRLVQRAASLPFDDHEESFPAALAVHMRLFDAVVDELEACHEDDPRWLDAAVELLGSTEDYAQMDLRDVLVDIDQDYDLSPAEHRRIRAAVANVPAAPLLRDQNDLTPAELGERVMAILRACIAYEDAVSRPTRTPARASRSARRLSSSSRLDSFAAPLTDALA